MTFISNALTNADPNRALTDRGSVGYSERFGPADQGAFVDLNLGHIRMLESVTFTLYFGIGKTRISAEQAAAEVGADLYVLAEPNSAETYETRTAVAIRADELSNAASASAALSPAK